MNVLALIPARGGSKGIPRKNLRVVAGRTLVEWSVRAAQESRLVTRVVVSSDDEEILVEGHRCGAGVQGRPAALATDEATTDAVLVHALALHAMAFGEPDLVVLLQPTCPVRRSGLVDDCINRLIETGADSLFTASALHFIWKRRAKHNGTAAPGWVQCNARGQRIRRQDFEDIDSRWAEDGSVFVSRAKLLRETGARIGGRIELFPNEAPGVDIDTEADLAVAEALLAPKKVLDGKREIVPMYRQT